MLSDYIPVYYPSSNSWSIPAYELMKYEDYVTTPQTIKLWGGHRIKGIPLLHFGTWGLFGVDVTKTIRAFAKDPEKKCAKSYKSKKVAADTAKFFVELKLKYPDIINVKPFDWPKAQDAPQRLRVPADCIVKEAVKPGKRSVTRD